MKEEQIQGVEKLILTFRDNQWTDQHGRRVVNPEAMELPQFYAWHGPNNEYTTYREQAEKIAEAYSEAHGVIEGLRARVAELEGALNRLYDHCPLLSDDNFTRDFKNALILAKAALSKTPSEGLKD